MTIYERCFKRALDILLATTAVIVLSPVFLIAALAILLDDGTPVLFRQVRVGRQGQPFTILKFRSMPVTAPTLPSADARGLRLTRIGGFIRRANIDELPQLFNVLLGQMSMVGPRPALPVQRELLELRRQRGVDRLRPGLTGLAQVNAYDGMPETEKVAWEARYANSLSGWRDITVLMLTFGYVLRRPPVY